jgi:hypothetical protein
MNLSKSVAQCNITQHDFYGWELLAPPPNRQATGPLLVGYPGLLIQYIHSYHPYLKASSTIHNLRKQHTVLKRDPLNMATTLFKLISSLTNSPRLRPVHEISALLTQAADVLFHFMHSPFINEAFSSSDYDIAFDYRIISTGLAFVWRD